MQIFEPFFKPEVRHSGRTFFAKGQVTSSRPSDNEVQAYIRGATTYKISFCCASIDSEIIFAACNCSSSQKGLFCKHIWAGLLKVEQSHSDFLDGKTEMEKPSLLTEIAETNKKTSTFSKTIFNSKPLSESQITFKEASKERQNDYRKLQYQKQKLRLQQKKLAKMEPPLETTPEPPFEIARALSFFTTNGFPLSLPCDISILNLAKKKLSRVFHPDAGGTHEEILELNRNFELLIQYTRTLR